MPQTTGTRSTAAKDKVPWRARIGWGCGGLADNYIMNSITPPILIMPIYNLVFGLDPVKIGIALAVPRLVDAFTDPLMGNISDNTRSRWGRRRPYIFIGAILSALLIPFLFTPPVQTHNFMFFYLMVMATALSLAYTVYVVPYTALGFELTPDYDEKTRVLAWRMYIGLIGSLTLPWAYRAAQSDLFSDTVRGAVMIGVFAAVVVIVTGLLPAITGREKVFAQSQAKVGLLSAVKTAFMNKSFTILVVAYLIIIGGVFSSMTLPLYINTYYVFDGDTVAASAVVGMNGTIMALTSYISLPLITWFSVRLSKRIAMMTGLMLAVVGTASTWLTITPVLPSLQYISMFIIGLGLQGCWLMVSTMTADVCDEEELRTGLRREGVYGAVISFTLKLAMSASAIVAGAVLVLSGYDTELANLTGQVDASVEWRMRVLFIVFQAVPMLIAAGLFLYYPITRQRAEQTQRLLKERHAEKNVKEYDSEL